MWTMNIPQREGSFWFYGDPFSSGQIALHYVEVRAITNGFVFITEGNFMYYKDGYWLEITLPELPVQESEEA